MSIKQKILDSLTWFLAECKKIFVNTKNVVNNTASDSTTFPLAAAQGKNLQNQINQLNTKLSKQEPFAWSGNATFGTDGIAVIPCDKNVKACSLLGTPIMYGEFLSFTFSASGGRILCRGLTGSQTVSGTIWLSVLGFVEYI